MFVIYILALVYFLFLSEGFGRTSYEGVDYRYNLIPFREIERFWQYRETLGFWPSFLNLAGNVIGFFPLGFILPIMSKRMDHFWRVLLLGFLFSLCVESIQLVCRVGCFDVDDLILNTTGAALGFVLFTICNRIRRLTV